MAENKRQNSKLLNEKGIALVMVLVLSAIALAIMAGLIYMLTSGTQISGIQKRYKTALEAGIGGSEISYQIIQLRGDKPSTDNFLDYLSAIGAYTTTPTSCVTDTTYTFPDGRTCSDIGSYTSIATKLNLPTECWSGCSSSLTVTPGTCAAGTATSNYDICFNSLGTNPQYSFYGKIVDTTLGNSGGDEGLLKHGVVQATGEIQVMSIPYLYTIEVDVENQANPAERSKLSILYQY